MDKFYAVILAGGLSKRIKSKIPKVFHKVSGKMMIEWSIEACIPLNPKKIFVVGNSENEDTLESVCGKYPNVEVVVQEIPRGTGDAVNTVGKFINDGIIYVAPGDAPLIKTETIKNMLDIMLKTDMDAVILSAEVPNPEGYGRIVRDGDRFIKIVEHGDANENERKIKEVNGGFYIFRGDKLFKALEKISPNNSQGEYYLTDVFNFFENVQVIKAEDWREILGVNTREQLAIVEGVMQERIKKNHMDNGVTFIMPENVYVEYSVKIGRDSIIYPFVALLGNTVIGENCVIGPFKVLNNETIPDGSEIW
ncbi:MAG: NTP transferase domain-containing protein [candidate division WOR-3 bacterium]